MAAVLNELQDFAIFQEVQSHKAWHGDVPGLVAEKLIRGNKTPYLFLLRKGENSTNENERHYYVTFTLEDGSVKHQPIVLLVSPQGWFYENTKPGGPYNDASIDDVLHLIMHCKKEECIPFIKQ
jgi:hypothetical protein